MVFKLRLLLIAFTVLGLIVPAKAQFFYTGRGNGLDVTVLSLVGVTVADTGYLPLNGGSLSSGLASASVTSGLTTVATTGVISTQTIGGAGEVDSFAQVDGLRIFPGVIPALDLVRATTVRSDASAILGSNSGSTLITNLVVLGNSVTVTGAPNQIYGVPGILSLTINRQTTVGGVLRVDALYLDILDPLRAGSIAVSSSYAGVAPAPEPSSACLLGLAIPGAFAVARHRRRR